MKLRGGSAFLQVSAQNLRFLFRFVVSRKHIKKQQFVHSDLKLKEMAALLKYAGTGPRSIIVA